jgi:cobalt-zinc-cadmium efflux system outer membrane protein
MYKIAIGLFVVAHLHAQSYEELLGQAINNSVKLQLIQNQQEQISLNGEIERRYENPSLELEVADFSSQFVSERNEFGMRVGLSQTLPLSHIQKDKENVTHNQINVVEKQYILEKSNFIYSFNLKYLTYKKAQKYVELQNESIAISKEVLGTVSHRYNNGAVAKSDYLEVQLDYKKMQSEQNRQLFQLSRAKNELLALANSDSREEIDFSHLFIITHNGSSHPLIALSNAKKEVSQAKLELLQHSVDSVKIFSELEREPEQNIFRIGISIALPTFNNHNQEKQLEKINVANQKLYRNNKERLLQLQIEQLIEENRELEELIVNHQSLIGSQEQLFDMYKKSYTIAKVNLLKLQQIKEQRISTKQEILESNFAIEQNNIKINYLQGAYSE